MEEHLTNVKAGVVLAGCYRVLSVLGASGASVVLDAEHTSSRQRFAIKVYDPALLESHPGGVDGFLDTAKKLTRVTGPNTIRVMTFGLLPSGAPYLALEYALGVDLRRLIKEAGTLSCEEAAHLVVQACESLEQAHALGLIHRELRPSNMFLVEQGLTRVLKVANYSIGTIVEGPTVSGTDDGAAIEYAAPEILRGDPIDRRVDIWALGITFVELTTGKRPWSAGDLSRLLAARVVITPPPLRLPGGQPAPPAVLSWLDRCLSDDPNDRFADAREAKLALQRAIVALQGPRPITAEAMLPDISGDDDTRAPWSSNDPTRVDGRALGVAATEVAEAPPPSFDATIVRDPSRMPERRPAFSQGKIRVGADATMVQDNPMAGPQGWEPPLELPQFVIKEASSSGRNLLLGGLAFALVVGLPLLYVYQRGRGTEEPPQPAATEIAPPPAPSIEDVTGRLEHNRVTTAASSGPQRFFAVPPTPTTKRR